MPGLALATLLALSIAACWPIWGEMWAIGLRDPENSHILIALPVAAFLAWQRRGRLRKLPIKPGFAGPATCLVAMGLITIGPGLGFDAFSHLGAVLLAIGAIVSVCGIEVVKRFRPSFLALLFLLPVPGVVRQAIALPLQDASAWAVEIGLDIFGVEVVRTGTALALNGTEVAVAEACNGMRMVSALGLVTLAFVFSVPMRNSVRLAFLALSPVVALAVNITRLIPTVLLYGYSDQETADFFHDISGWGALLAALAMLSAVLWLLRWCEIPVSPVPVHTD
ncbi:MAG: exosortase/archaeosortase family protein [Planctomycetota bacterium]